MASGTDSAALQAEIDKYTAALAADPKSRAYAPLAEAYRYAAEVGALPPAPAVRFLAAGPAHLQRVQQRTGDMVGRKRSLVEELIGERRESAKHE